MSNPLVSVITPCHNDGLYIMEAVVSIQESNYPNIEHIIVDDGSDQFTKEILAKIHFSNVRIVSIPASGVCMARNTAINLSSGKYILPLDADDKVAADYINSAVECFESKEDCRVVTTEIIQFFGTRKDQVKWIGTFDMGLLLSRNLFGISTMFRREDAKKVGGFDQLFRDGVEDWDFWISIMSLGGTVEVVNGINFYYRIKKKHRNNSFSSEQLSSFRRSIWEKHKELFSMYYADPNETDSYLGLVRYRNFSILRLVLLRIKCSLQKII